MSDMNPKHLDKRTQERYLRTGALEDKVFDKYLKGLPDVAEKMVSVETVMEENDDDELDDVGAEA